MRVFACSKFSAQWIELRPAYDMTVADICDALRVFGYALVQIPA